MLAALPTPAQLEFSSLVPARTWRFVFVCRPRQAEGRESRPVRGKPLAFSLSRNPPPPPLSPPLFSAPPFFPFLQACVMSLSP